MPRNRLLKKEFFTDPKVGSLPLGARLLFEALWVNADDTGHGVADCRLLKAQAFPYDADITPEAIQDWLRQMADARMVRLYDVADQHYFEVPNFLKHQVISHPSKFEYPKPEDSENTHGVIPEHSALKSTSKVTSKKNEKENVKSTETAADAADGEQADRTRRGDDSDLTETADGHTCTRKVKSNEDVLRFAGLERKRFGKDVDPRFYGKLSGVFVEYRERCHQDGRCDCVPSEFLDDVIRACEDDNIRYPPGVLARLKQLQRAA